MNGTHKPENGLERKFKMGKVFLVSITITIICAILDNIFYKNIAGFNTFNILSDIGIVLSFVLAILCISQIINKIENEEEEKHWKGDL